MAVLNACQPGGSGDEGIDPGIVEIPIAFIRRPIPVDDMGVQLHSDIRDPRLFSAGGDVYLRASSSVNATATNITASVTGGTGDVKGLGASYDGSKLIFSLRLFDPDPNDQIVPKWDIYEYEIATGILRPVINNITVAQRADDMFPAYLPDGRIVFSSTRQDQAKGNMVNEGKQSYTALAENENNYALVLHVMNDDGSGIRQISQNLSHDLFPQVLRNVNGGQIVFSRWDHAAISNAFNLYRSNPDGSDLELLYGAHSHLTGTSNNEIHFTQPREMGNGDIVVIARPFTDTFDGGDIVVIDSDRFVDNDKPVWTLAGLPGPAQRSATVNNVSNDPGVISVAGRYSSAFPLQDGSNRLLVSKSTCQVSVGAEIWPCIEPYLSSGQEESPAYGIWLYDMDKDTEKPIILPQPGIVITEAIAVQASLRPPVIPDKGPELDNSWLAENLGVVNIKSVYDLGDGSAFDGSFFGYPTTAASISSVSDFADPANALAADRPARFVRFIKPVGLPDRNDPNVATSDLANEAFGRQRNLGMREIVGYAPVEPDGSVKVKVPGETPLALEVLDAEGRRIGPRHNNWFQVRSGDMLTCTGCHTHATAGITPAVHGRSDATRPSINSGIPAGVMRPEYVNTQIPGTTEAYWSAAPGSTMAEVRFDRVNSVLPLPAPEPRLSADLIYVDYWTDPTVTRPDASIGPDASYSYLYDDLDPSILTPASGKSLRNANCKQVVQPEWRFNCRVTINYPRHIQAIWELPRGVDTWTILDPTVPTEPLNGADPTATLLNVDTNMGDGIPDDTCVSCHTAADAMGNARVPYGQLDLTPDPNQLPNDFYRSYVEMFFNRTGQILDGNMLRNFQIDVPNPDPLVGGTITIDDPDAVIAPRMSANGARSSFFIEKMTGTELDVTRSLPIVSTYDHVGKLSGAELKLISEWLDLGGQNFNDLFDVAVPQN
ncbi:MAG: hypothetical protein OEO19_01540 [Gammaproteobacteria bacterium]|nr:hypothetical protein [Gammaproteobacteria bacterium]MDH3447428.1 hypothetical protein [Gammaproteobacteria bacterium]